MITYIIIAITLLISIPCFSNRSLFYKLSLSPYNVVHKNEWYRVLTHGFVHADYTHLIINMLVFWSFGQKVEQIMYAISPNNLGAFTFISLYVGALIFASMYDITKHKDNYYYNSIGASGAVTAVVFTSIFFNPWDKIYFFAIVPIPAIVFGALYLWYESYMSGKKGDNVNHHAHIFGAIFGFLFPIAMRPEMFSYFINQLLNFKF